MNILMPPVAKNIFDKRMLIMKFKYWFSMLLIFLYVLPAYSLPVESIYTKFKRHEIKCTKVKGTFAEVYPENSITNTREFIFTPAFLGLKYFQVDNGKYSFDLIEINKQKFLLITYDYLLKGATFLLQSHPDWSDVYEIEYNHKKFLCVTLEVSGSGSSQEINDYAVFDMTDNNHITYSCISSRFSGIDAFGDYNGDGALDFAFIDSYKDYKKLKRYNHESTYYVMSYLTFKDGDFLPINNLAKVIIERDKNFNFRIIAN